MEEDTRQIVFETNGKTYKELYDNIIEENLRNSPPEGENTIEHHIRPRSIFPDLIYSRENLVRLTEKVHLKVHYLLWQHYKRETDDSDSERKMCTAFWNMVHEIEWKGDTELGWIADRYEELRVDFRKRISGENNPMKRPEVRAKMSENAAMKRPEVREKIMGENNPSKRPEVRKKLSEALKGENHPMYGKHPSDETRKKMSESHRGHEVSEETRAKMSKNNAMRRPEVRAKFMGENHPMKRPEVRAKFMGENHPRARKVLQFTRDGLFLAEFPTAQEAMRMTGVKYNKISMCCHGKRKTAGGYVWRFKEVSELSRKVLQYSLDGTFVAEYPSIRKAAVKTNSRRRCISLCCAGKLKTHNGFVWKYDESA